MRKRIAVFLAAAICLTLFSVVASAQTPARDAALKLNELGLFQGVGTNADGTPDFDLDRPPTRYEAVTMLVRMLGKEEDAKRTNWKTPFTDVDDWAKPYVGYAFINSLTAGTSSTTFSGSETITASQYITFVLRALGYSSDTDFSWDSAWVLSDKLGITQGQYNSSAKAFLRGDVAAISFDALSVNCKNEEFPLFETLISTGAFSDAAAVKAGLKDEVKDEETADNAAEEEDTTQDSLNNDFIWLEHNGYITYSVKGNSITNTDITIRNISENGLCIVIPLGTFFSAGSSRVQNMVVRSSHTIWYLGAGESTTVSLRTACMNIEKDIPNSSNSFTASTLEENSRLARVIKLCDERGATYAITQAAVWIVTDGPSDNMLLNTLHYDDGSMVIKHADLEAAKEIVRIAG